MKVLEYPFDSSYILKNKIKLKKELENDGTVRSPIKIAVLGGSTTHDICICLQIFLLNQGIDPVIYESKYNNYWEESIFTNDKMKKFNPDIIYIHTSSRNISAKIESSDDSQSINRKLEEQYLHFEEMWEKLRREYQCIIIQNNFERPLIRLYGNKDISDIHGFSNFVNRLNNKLYDFSQKVSWLYINDIDYISSVYGLEKWNDFTSWYLYKYAMAISAIPDFCYNLSNIIKSLYGKNKKVLAMDLDNTLWDGIIGEDGINGIVLGNDSGIGEMYGEIQKYIKLQKQIGVILAINSKNDMSNVNMAFSHPDMQVTLEDFTAIEVNWNNKDENIVKIAEKLNIGIDSIVFVDDNPVERKIVKEQLPVVTVPELSEPEKYIKIINGSGYFEVTNLSDEDKRRSELYNSMLNYKTESKRYANYDEFLESLSMEGVIREIDEKSIHRVTQLINKTNQFNLTTRRLAEDDLKAFMNDKKYITLYGRLKDRFCDNGIVSVIIGEKRKKEVHIIMFLMSCRVFKRGMEEAMLDEFFRRLDSMDDITVFGHYYRTKKNTMVENLYQDMGFSLYNCTDISKVFVIKKEDYQYKNKNIRMV